MLLLRLEEFQPCRLRLRAQGERRNLIELEAAPRAVKETPLPRVAARDEADAIPPGEEGIGKLQRRPGELAGVRVHEVHAFLHAHGEPAAIGRERHRERRPAVGDEVREGDGRREFGRERGLPGRVSARRLRAGEVGQRIEHAPGSPVTHGLLRAGFHDGGIRLLLFEHRGIRLGIRLFGIGLRGLRESYGLGRGGGGGGFFGDRFGHAHIGGALFCEGLLHAPVCVGLGSEVGFSGLAE